MLTRAEVHRLVLERLLELRGDCVQEVRLVSRLYNDELLGGDAVHDVFFFVPDLHLMTAVGDAAYRYGFLRASATVRVRRDVVLDALCQAMLDVWNALPSGQVVRTVQLGDFMDLWREAELGQSGAAVATRILAENPVVQRRLVRRTGNDALAADVLIGNHDPGMAAAPGLAFVRRSLAYDVGGAFTLLATHGDRFDDLENAAPDDLQEQLVEWFGPGVEPGTYQLDRTRDSQPGGLEGAQGSPPATMQRPSDADQVADWVNLWTVRSRGAADRQAAHELLPEALVRVDAARRGKAKTSLGLDGALPDLRTVVVGHSHHPRIVVCHGADPSQNLVLVDCGAWLENSRLGNAVVPSCHFGVMTGGDVRIYQLDPAAKLLENLP